MKKHVSYCLVLICFVFPKNLLAWGQTGHRVVGEIAMQNVKNRTKRNILKLLNNQSLAAASNHADYIKSDPEFDDFYTWHFVNFDEDQAYNPNQRNPKGDIVFGIEECLRILKNPFANKTDKAFYLKMLAHLVGDLHQPLHVGKQSDKGGNDIKVEWFWQPYNLHRVWDQGMIDHYQMSYTELANDLPNYTNNQKKQWQQGTVLDWTYESKALAKQVYASATAGDKLKWEYQYQHFGTVKEQLLKAGLRLAKILDDIFA